jgi:4-diphosphocytidyl-2-C-methyl-D-erythritol kinase
MDESNLVTRAATLFLEAAGQRGGVRIHLEKRLPIAAGLGGGSANAATTLRGLNRLMGEPLDPIRLTALASRLGSDVPFFLQDGPALCTGRGEQIESLAPFEALRGKAILLIRPAFGISTAWAYGALAQHPELLEGRSGRAAELIQRLRRGGLAAAAGAFFNSLEAPVFHKYPWLALLKEHLISEGALVAMMSGSGSTTFAITHSVDEAETLGERALARFGNGCWKSVAPL